MVTYYLREAVNITAAEFPLTGKYYSAVLVNYLTGGAQLC